METNIQQLVINESYWSFFKANSFRKQDFLSEEIDKSSSIASITKNLAIFAKIHDADLNAIYGIEIKTNGSERSSRIPMVRFTPKNQSIWKVVKALQDVDKALIDLQDLVYYLQNTKKGDYPLPQKVLIVTAEEDDYEKSGMQNYIKKKVEETGIIWVSLSFLESIFSVTERYDLNKLFTRSGSIFTAKTL